MKPVFRLLSVSAALALFASACATQPATQEQPSAPGMSARASEIIRDLKIQGQTDIQVLDVGRGKKTNAAFAVTFKTTEADFSTKASVDGAIAKVLADVSDYELFLFDCSSAPSPGAAGAETDLNAGTPCSQSFNAGVTSANTGSQTFIFDNVGQSTGRFFVGVSAMENIPPMTNITEFTGYVTTGTHPAPGPIALSNGGGDSDGGVGVDASFAVSNTAQVTISLGLLDALGATLDSQVTVADGNASLSGTPGVSSP